QSCEPHETRGRERTVLLRTRHVAAQSENQPSDDDDHEDTQQDEQRHGSLPADCVRARKYIAHPAPRSHIGPMGVLGGLGFAALFYAAAEYEHMTGWKWALASLALSATVKGLFPLSFIFILPTQFGLFCVLWWMNTKR